MRVDLGNAAEWAAVVAAVASAVLAWWKAREARDSAEAAEADRKAAHEARMAVEEERNEIQGRIASAIEQQQRAEDERRRTEQAELVSVKARFEPVHSGSTSSTMLLATIANDSRHPITDCVAMVGCGAEIRHEAEYDRIPGGERRPYSPAFESCKEPLFFAFQFRDRHGQVWHRTMDGTLHEGEFHPGG